MFRADLQWFFPESAEEAAGLLEGREIVPHAGGTGLLRTKPPAVRALVDLSALPLRFREEEPRGEIRLGAMLTFADLVDAGAATAIEPSRGVSSAKLRGSRSDPLPSPARRLLAAALSPAASTPLRARITLGGSAADASPWSDLTAPLLCLEAEVVLLRRGEGGRIASERLPYAAYLADRGRLPPHLLREVVVRGDDVEVFGLARLSMVRFDYAACRLALAARLEGGRLERPRFWLAGTRGRLARLEGAERAADGRRPDGETARRAAEAVEAAFASDPRFSAAYKLRWTRAALRDALLAMGREPGGRGD